VRSIERFLINCSSIPEAMSVKNNICTAADRVGIKVPAHLHAQAMSARVMQ
jgi:hypothetical protein